MSAAMEEYAPLMMLGVRVRAVADLEESAIWCENMSVLIVDDGLTRPQRENINRQMMDRLLDAEEIAAL